jgi:hypothetical protein
VLQGVLTKVVVMLVGQGYMGTWLKLKPQGPPADRLQAKYGRLDAPFLAVLAVLGPADA